MTSIVFSKDRAMQLDAFLRSYKDHVTPPSVVHVLYLATTDRHAAAYDTVFRYHPFVVPHKQTAFKEDLFQLLPGYGSAVFFVDDQVFVRPWTVLEEPGLSLRLGLHLTCCYPHGDIPQTLPPYLIQGSGMVVWRWDEGALDWGYPLSVDGHVFDARELRLLLDEIDFHSPNSLEATLQQFRPMFWDRWGACYRASRVVNVPWNLVQTDCVNRCADPVLSSAAAMLEFWEKGLQINVRPLYGVLNQSAHQEFPLVLESRAERYRVPA